MRLHTLPLWVCALWVMSLSVLGFFVVPMLFIHLPTPALAGGMAAKLFTVQTAVSASCGALLLVLFRSNLAEALTHTAPSATVFVAAGILLALLAEFGVAPHIVARENLAVWHRVGSLMYLVQWGCAATVFGKLTGAALRKPDTSSQA